MRYLLIVFSLIFLFSCDRISKALSGNETTTEPVQEEEEFVVPENIDDESPYLITIVDKLTMRSRPSIEGDFVTKIPEGDSLIYLNEQSSDWLNFKLRGKYFHEPWLKVEIKKSGKKGWVYGGGVSFDSQMREEAKRYSTELSAERFKEDARWEGTLPTDWTTAGIDDSHDFKTFLIHFRDWIVNDEVEKIAKHLAYPVDPVYSKSQFIDNYEQIFDDSLRRIIFEQPLHRIFRNSQGAMIGSGQIWFRKKDGDYKIIALNAYADKVKDQQKIKDYAATFEGLQHVYTRPSKEANPPQIIVKLTEKALSGEYIKYIGNQKEVTIFDDFEYKYSENKAQIFEIKIGKNVQQRLTFSERKNGSIELIFDDFKNYKAGQRFIYLE